MKLQINNIGLETFLKLIALVVIISIFLKSIIDIDPHYDTWWYHLPFAARIWGIVPREVFLLENTQELRFEGFTLLGEFFQGFFWFITQRVQAANLVCFFSLITYIYFLRTYCQIPLYLSVIALLAIPLVLTHATTCYVDLPGNIGVAILILMTYLLYARKHLYTKRDLLIIFLAGAYAANIKPQLVPLVFLILCFIVFRILWLKFKQIQDRKTQWKWLLKFIPIMFLASTLIFATSYKNIIAYGNPFYPTRIEVAGVVLNHKKPLYNAVPDSLADASKAHRWALSLLEYKSPHWSVDQWNGNNPDLYDRMGGFFGAYVVFNLLLLGYIFLRDRCRETITACILVTIMSVVAANFPQSHELRYFMYWMISLVSINLYLVSRYERSSDKLRWLKPKNSGVVYALFLAIVLAKIGYFYAKPTFYSLDELIQKSVKPEILSQIHPGDSVCILVKKGGSTDPAQVDFAAEQHIFLYTPKFHPDLDYTYSIKAAVNPRECSGRKQIP